MLEAVNLSCARGDRTLFRGISFTLESGRLLHVTGQNGSGKTTLLRTLCGLTHAEEGVVRWQGIDMRVLGDEYRAQFAYLGHLDGAQGELTALENLHSTIALSGGDAMRAESALEQVALSSYAAFPAKILSQGQKRRLAFARLLTVDRPLWILDEPLTALDTNSVEMVLKQLQGHLERGGAAVVTSHQTLEAIPSRRLLSLDS